MSQVKLTKYAINGLSINMPEVWTVETEQYTELDGRECAMIEISAEDGDPRSIVISYGPMPEGSDALMEAAGTYEEIIDDISSDQDDDPICDYDFLDKTAYGFTFQTEGECLCNSFLCVALGSDVELETGVGCKLMTILTTATTYEDIDDLLNLIEENLSFE